jgi:hypothetical protein
MDFIEGFDMFTFMPIFIGIFFAIVVGIILFTLFRGIREWGKNNHQPRLNVDAVAVSKRTQVSGGGHDHHSSTWYHVTFQVESGDRMEFSVSGKEYGQIAEGDVGELTFQGTRYHAFTRKQNSNP